MGTWGGYREKWADGWKGANIRVDGVNKNKEKQW
jgi:hypothetical protein